MTKISSSGLWVPVHHEEWDQDAPVDHTNRITTLGKEPEFGIVSFEGPTLPWTIGQYEVSHSRIIIMPYQLIFEQRSVTITMASIMC